MATLRANKTSLGKGLATFTGDRRLRDTAVTDHPGYKWYILTLAALTGALALAVPSMSMSVLFQEISTDLNLSLVQVGLVWSIASLPGMVICLVAGAINDRFGPKRVMIVSTFLIAIAGASRGLATNFPTLLLGVLLFGFLGPLISTSSLKITGLWFPPRQLGLANGIFTMGFATGFFVSSLISASVMSVWLDGWRNVLFFYGVLAVMLCIPWIFTRPAPSTAGQATPALETIPMRQALAHVFKLKNVWLLGATLMFVGGAMQALNGYLPLYLRGQGWNGMYADGGLALFHLMSMLFVLPVALLSDRLKSRKTLLLGMTVIAILGVSLLSFANGPLVYVAIIMMGMVRDASMALIFAMVIETKGVGPLYAGSATGLVLLFLNFGGLYASPLGNRLASVSPSLPFIFWAGMTALGLLCLVFVKVPQRQA
jgi:nitrate/nitrite transporter NarK